MVDACLMLGECVLHMWLVCVRLAIDVLLVWFVRLVGGWLVGGLWLECGCCVVDVMLFGGWVVFLSICGGVVFDWLNWGLVGGWLCAWSVVALWPV